jgi:hypothetical protein
MLRTNNTKVGMEVGTPRTSVGETSGTCKFRSDGHYVPNTSSRWVSGWVEL